MQNKSYMCAGSISTEVRLLRWAHFVEIDAKIQLFLLFDDHIEATTAKLH